MNLVERLRNDIQQWGDFGTLKSEAAAEIERLQAFKDSIIDNSDEYKKVLADNERLRGALRKMADQPLSAELGPDEEDADYCGAYDCLISLAREALEKSDE
ncbi:MAG: hypothetical protein ACYSUK_00185 [Planctomycetota bacterium]|jgi:hypothetical protein